MQRVEQSSNVLVENLRTCFADYFVVQNLFVHWSRSNIGCFLEVLALADGSAIVGIANWGI